MNNKIIIVFCLLMIVFILIACIALSRCFRENISSPALFIGSGISFFLLGSILFILSKRSNEKGMLRNFLMLTGLSSIGFFVSVILHNLIYGLFIHFFGSGFWDSIGLGDEPIFFLIAVIVCPIGFIVGSFGSIILFIKNKISIIK